jgi:hypothetical protein
MCFRYHAWASNYVIPAQAGIQCPAKIGCRVKPGMTFQEPHPGMMFQSPHPGMTFQSPHPGLAV